MHHEIEVPCVADSNFASFNGNLANHITAFNLFDIPTDPAHRKFVNSYIYMKRV